MGKYMENRNFATRRDGVSATYDAGLRAHFQQVYNMMALGLVISGVTAFGVASTPALFQLFHGTILGIIVAVSPIFILLFALTPAKVQGMQVNTVAAFYLLLTALMGVSLSYIFALYSGQSIARVFFITAGMFAGTSIYGYATRKDLSSLGSLMFMGLLGLILASIVNIFMQSAMVHFVISGVGVIVFTGLIAFDTQRIKETYSYSHGHEANAKMAIMGALSLYYDFVNLFLMLLRLFGNSRN